MFVPPGYGVVSPYLFVDDAASYVDFLASAFGAEEVDRSLRTDGRIANSQLSFSGTMIMLSEASTDFPASRAAYYLYVTDADASMARAVAAGAIEIMAVADMPYGDRQGGVRDVSGNIWWISQRLVAGPYT